MDIKDIVTGLTDVSTGDYYVRGIIYFVWQGKVVGTWDDCEHEQGRRDISSAFWSRFLGTEKIKGSANFNINQQRQGVIKTTPDLAFQPVPKCCVKCCRKTERQIMIYKYECDVCTGGCVVTIYTLDDNPKPINCLLHKSDLYTPEWKPKDSDNTSHNTRMKQ